MRASGEQIRALADDPAVDHVWPDLPVHVCLSVSVPHIQVPRVWAAGFSGDGVPIAILDTGIDPSHPDFAGRIAGMVDFTGQGPRDNHGHGTHVAGIACGSGETYRGVAPGASIYSARVLHADGSGYMSEVMAGLDWAVERGVRVINLSLGGAGPSDGSDALSAACDAAVDLGVFVCAAAGNYGPQPSTIATPGCAEKVLTIGACSNRDAIARFSGRGPTDDGRVKPDIVMPGVDIASCRAERTSVGTPLDALYTRMSGTSMATPHATGAVACLLEAFPELTPAQVKERFVRTAKDLGMDANAQGSGRADVYHAYVDEAVVPSPPLPGPRPGCLVSLLHLLVRDQ